ncbi:MAG: glycosyltransferase [Chthoniobacterales bacterium]|nr:glycosyltransferase [Chthoniobacterales bacterium]
MPDPPPKRPLRALHVIDSLSLGGAQTVLLNFAKHWKPHEIVMHVATMHGDGFFAQQLRNSGIPVFSLSRKKFPPSYLWNLPKLLAKNRYDIAHFHLFGANWIGKPIAKFLKTPCIIAHDHCNDHARNSLFPLLLDRLTNPLAHAILAVSESTRQFLLSKEKLPPEKVHLVYNGIDTDQFKPTPNRSPLSRKDRPPPSSILLQKFGIPPSATIIGGVGRLAPQKNFTLWLHTAAALLEDFPQIFFLIAGEGPELPRLQKLAKKLNIDKKVIFTGFLADRVSLYGCLDILLLTSHYEGLPMTILEAMAAGIPIVSSNIDGPAEILTNQLDALLVSPNQPTLFVSAVKSLLSNPSLASNLAANARRKVCQHFNASKQAQKVLEIYHKVLFSQKTPP